MRFCMQMSAFDPKRTAQLIRTKKTAAATDPQSLHTDLEAAKNGENEVVNVSG